MIAYLDNSATTKPCALAVERMNRTMTEGYFNPSSLYAPAIQVERELRATRELICATLSVSLSAYDVIFTSGGTEANNLALLGAVSAMHGRQTVISSGAEHPSVLAALEALGGMGHNVELLPLSASGDIDWDTLRRALEQKPALVSLMQVNNETGATLDVPRLSALVRGASPNSLIHVDGVQGYLRLPVDARMIDLYTLSAHKIHGPKGAGALVVRKGVRLLPRQLGGGQQGAVRSGTENTPGIAGLAGAIEHMGAIDELSDRLMRAKLRFFEGVKDRVEGLLVNGPAPEDGAPHIINLNFPGVRGEVLLHALEAGGVYCSTGSACSSKKRKLSAVLLAMGIGQDRAESALRFSFCPDTTDEQIDYAVQVIGDQYAQLKRFRRR